jgi:hypothetical protein
MHLHAHILYIDILTYLLLLTDCRVDSKCYILGVFGDSLDVVLACRKVCRYWGL